MSIESTAEYKQDKINVRNINAIILTGRCYKYKDNYYELEESAKRTFKGEIFGNVEARTAVLFKNILTNEKFIRLSADFYKKFEHITEQLL